MGKLGSDSVADTRKEPRAKPSRSMGVNMGDIARLANVSKPTVSRVLNDSPLVSKETRERVLDVARAQGYAVNRNAQKLRQLRTSTIAVLLDFGSHRRGRIGDPFVFELLAGVSEALSIRNQDLLLSPPGLTDAKKCVDLLRARAADGFIFLGQGGREPMLRELARSDAAVRRLGRGRSCRHLLRGRQRQPPRRQSGRRPVPETRCEALAVRRRHQPCGDPPAL